jgi:penicillin-binding protein 2
MSRSKAEELMGCMHFSRYARAIVFFTALLLAVNASAATRKHHGRRTVSTARSRTHKSTRRARRIHHTAALHAAAPGVAAKLTRTKTTTRGVIHARVRSTRRRKSFSPWSEPTFAESTVGDLTAGEDPVVRKAAVDALGPYNGTVVVEDPQTGRILSIVNQKLALTGAFEPCSTIKVVVSLASLTEGIVDPEKAVHISRRNSMNLTNALAKSNNAYFAKLGEELGFERIQHYAQLFGLGEKAGWNVAGEEPGTVVDKTPSDGLGMMTSFGSGIRVTPLELASIVSTVSNGGTMYYLQYPRSAQAVQQFQPKVKRQLPIEEFIPSLKAGMRGAVEYGTARRAKFDPDEPVFGKTGTCTDTAKPGVHLGWFGSFNDVSRNKVAVVVLLTGGRGVSGPVASGIAGQVYRNLEAQNFFAPDVNTKASAPLSLLSLPTALH